MTGGVADYDYIFADDEREANPTSFKFLQMAHAWAASRKAGEAGGGAGSGGGGGGALSRFASARVRPPEHAPCSIYVPHDDRAVVPKREHLINSTTFGR